ncbi:phosphatidylinositol 4-phosphate 5-kinase 10-like isoform X1 [Punica granatum]|uniref:1-phosphatidylinositol-4-phosphate 5-kinase n=1 Tax=Punica granatum TaxID=22663 RepID=A0A6P8C1N2_PUNGR|nr:phosphatidylinositol 4-phosphate 5-kinase 10-like isoform X1 [Punica granatum]XP_031376472.1 phosphatidylinositol 4-phosphate 5-kinase 10-like isoform X1 [Punica granatum]
MELDTGAAGPSPLDFKHSQRTIIRCSEHEYSFLSPGTVAEFDWKDYCPAVFRHIQALDNINYDDYMLSICGHEILHDVSSTTRPGALHYLPHDDRFMIKTLKKSEVKVLQEMLPNYYRHLKKYRASLLAKFYGLHFIRPSRGPKVYFVVMSNILKSDQFIHMSYDLKGSSQGRSVNKLEYGQKTILKEIDLDFRFYLDPLTRVRLLTQIKYDCEFLESEGIMDYSLLLGVHVETSHQGIGSGKHPDADVACEDRAHSKRDFELTMPDLCEPNFRPRFRLGVNVPARAIRTPKESNRGIMSMKTEESYNVFLYCGIIDLFQSYSMSKRIEHAYKSLQYDSKLISAVNPKAYSSRFQEFLSTIFQENESDL